MKPHGPIPPGFAAIDGELAIDGHKTSDLVMQADGTPLFVYSRAVIRNRIEALRHAMPPQLRIHYAMKANPHAPLLAFIRDLVDGFDIASAGELEMALASGQSPTAISFAGPGKRDFELELAIRHGVTLNIESATEAKRALQIADRLGITPLMALRINPDFELRGSGMKMGGGAKPFGVDADRASLLARELIASGAQWRGWHIFAGSQALDATAIVEMQEKVLDLALSLTREVGERLPRLNMGGGFGIPYFHGDMPLDVNAIGSALTGRLAELPEEMSATEFAIELGRYLVGEAGVYLARIVDRKESHGQTFLITDGGLHHQLAASGNFGTVVRRNYPVAVATRFGDEASEQSSIVGCLCTPLDRLADQVFVPRAQAGDVVAIFCAGAYGATASPAAFLGHRAAAELLI